MAHVPKDLDKDTIHCFGPNSFKLHRLPVPRPGEVLGLVGVHSIGKSTALNILAGRVKPNLGQFNNPPDWPEILTHLPDKELKSFLTQIIEKKLKVAFKPQCILDIQGSIPRVRTLLEKVNQRGMMKEVCDDLELNKVLNLQLTRLSRETLQRVTIAAAFLQKADVYIFDEPSHYLDARLKFRAAKLIRSLLTPHSYVIVVDSDLSVLDYLSDTIYCLYGKPEAYGVFTLPFNARAGIEIFLDGFDPREKLRIRDESLAFEVASTAYASDEEPFFSKGYKYPDMTITSSLGFKLEVTAGEFTDSQIVVLLGDSNTGKTLFIKMLVGLVKPDRIQGVRPTVPELVASYKPQKNVWKGECTVRQVLETRVPIAQMHDRFVSDVIKPLQIEQLLDRNVGSLLYAETQRVAITLCLATSASVYLIDVPSAYLDSEQRINAAMAIKRHVKRMGAAAVIVEHDLIMATYLADQVIVFNGTSSPQCATTTPPCSLVRGMNQFLQDLDITFKRDTIALSYTPRVNKLGSIEDTKQKCEGRYYFDY